MALVSIFTVSLNTVVEAIIVNEYIIIVIKAFGEQ
jgi:hypothetical protein